MRIILCDDHPIVVISMTLLFESRGHTVVATTDHPRHLPELVAVHEPDVLLLDLFYADDPAMSVSTLVGDLAARADVVILTGSADPARSQAALAAGAAAVASKCLPSEDLVALVEGRTGRAAAELDAVLPDSRYLLTGRQQQVLQCLIDGDSTSRIARHLDLRQATVRSHVQSVLLKMGVHNRGAAVALGIREGLTVSRR